MSDATRIQKEFLEAIKDVNSKKTKPYDVTAKVTRVEDGKMYVHVPGGVDETPVEMTMSAKTGDLVKVRVANGRAWVTGNASAPPTDDKEAKAAQSAAIIAQKYAAVAQETAETAQYTAKSAERVADSALISANGKNRIYYSGTEPTGTFVVGDTWFDTAHGNAIYQWDGTDWTPEQLGEDAIAELSIKTAHIQDGAISNAKIGNLDAGKITTGTLTAIDITGSTITGSTFKAIGGEAKMQASSSSIDFYDGNDLVTSIGTNKMDCYGNAYSFVHHFEEDGDPYYNEAITFGLAYPGDYMGIGIPVSFNDRADFNYPVFLNSGAYKKFSNISHPLSWEYTAGATISSSGYVECAGRTANSGRTLAFQIPLARPIEAGKTLTLDSSTGLAIYYYNGSTSEQTISAWAPTSVTLTYDDFGIRVTMPRSSAWQSSTNRNVTVVLHNLSISIT